MDEAKSGVTVGGMSWQQYVRQHATGRTQVALADAVGVSQTAVSRWLKGTQGVDAGMAIQFARAVGDEPLVALIAAGYLTGQEAKARPAGPPDYAALSSDELLALVRARMREGNAGDQGTTSTAQAESTDDDQEAVPDEKQRPTIKPVRGSVTQGRVMREPAKSASRRRRLDDRGSSPD